MGKYFIPQPGATPQTGNNRSMSELVDDILEYTGGEGDKDDQKRAARALDSSVRRFNDIAWRFNRRSTTITFVNDTAEYTFAASDTIRNVLRVRLLDSNDVKREYLPFMRWEDWTKIDPDQSAASSVPYIYTIRNMHREGKIIFSPPSSTPTSRPKAFVDYHVRITVPAFDTFTINVPSEVEEALVAEAVAIMIAKGRSFTDAVASQNRADLLRKLVEIQHKDWPDSAGHME